MAGKIGGFWLAEITSDQSGAQSKSAGATAQLQRLIRLPAVMRWVAVLGIFVVVLIICLAAWGPDMDFPSEVSMEKDGVSESREISRLISDEIKKGTTWLVRNWGSMFDGIDKAITLTMVQLEDGLRWIPWPATFLASGGNGSW